MSLVAYGDSDDGSSDSEQEETSLKQKDSVELVSTLKDINPLHSDNTKSPQTEKRSRLSSLLPKPQNTSKDRIIVNSEPIKLPDLKTLQDGDEDEIIHVDEEYIPLKELKKNDVKTKEKTENQKSVGSLFSRMPSPWSLNAGVSLPSKRQATNELNTSSAKKGKQPVRIAAPTLENIDSDDESEYKERTPKIVKQAKAGSGLSALLPKPKHSVTLTASNPNKPSAKLANRSLIPHTLTKKPAKNIKTKNKIEARSQSDDEEEPESFFTFNDKNDHEITGVKDGSQLNTTPISTFTSSIKVKSIPEVNDEYPEPAETNVHSELDDVGGATGQSFDNSTTTTYYQSPDESQSYAYTNYGQDSYTTYYNTQPSHSTAQQPNQDIDILQMQRLQGRKNRNEPINIIDINASDQTADTKVQLTNLTAEQFAHNSSKKKGNMPSSQQRRKHQITYLAFQAKEREFELQQQWASNRQTKRQTQAKYGF